MPRYVGPQLMAELKKRYQTGEISKNQYLIEKAKLEDKIARGHDIERPLWEHILKWFAIIVLVGLAAAMFFLFDDWLIRIMALPNLAIAGYMAITP